MKIDRIKEWLKALLDILRLRNCIIVFLGVLIAAEIALYDSGGGMVLPIRVIIAGISACMITAAGNVINDYFDFEIDKVNKPERPIPAGKISRSDALMLSFALFLIGLGLAKYVNPYCLSLAGLNSILLVVYGKYSKKMLLISNMMVSYLVASVFIFGAFSVANGVDLLRMGGFRIIALLSSCAFLVTFSREVTKDLEDIEGDKKRYSITLPIWVGVKNAKNMVMLFVVFAVLLSLVPFITHPRNFDLYSYALPIITADLLFIISMTMDPSISQRVMVLAMFLALVGFSLATVMPKVT